MSLPHQENEFTSDRREFLHRMVGAGVAVAGSTLLAGCASGGLSVAGAQPVPAPGTWDMSWKNKLARYRTAYDSPEVMGAAALSYADAAWAGYTMYGVPESDFTPILILRHRASVMVLNDAMWARLALGEARKINDPTTGEPARRNPFINWKEGDKHSDIDKTSGIDTLLSRGAIVMACNYALTGAANTLREREKDRGWTEETSLAEIHRNVMPGCYVMPNGIFAVAATQDAGANYMRVLV
jgi:hypothetical protein